MVWRSLCHVPGEHGSHDPCSPGTWCCTDETGQHCIFLRITWCMLGQSQSHNSGRDITVNSVISFSAVQQSLFYRILLSWLNNWWFLHLGQCKIANKLNIVSWPSCTVIRFKMRISCVSWRDVMLGWSMYKARSTLYSWQSDPQSAFRAWQPPAAACSRCIWKQVCCCRFCTDSASVWIQQGLCRSWQVMEFKICIFQSWKFME